MFEHVLKHLSFTERLDYVNDELAKVSRNLRGKYLDKKDMELAVEPIVMMLGQCFGVEEYATASANEHQIVWVMNNADIQEWEHGKIPSIKWLRTKTGYGLKDAKDECERVCSWYDKSSGSTSGISSSGDYEIKWLVSEWRIKDYQGQGSVPGRDLVIKFK